MGGEVISPKGESSITTFQNHNSQLHYKYQFLHPQVSVTATSHQRNFLLPDMMNTVTKSQNCSNSREQVIIELPDQLISHVQFNPYNWGSGKAAENIFPFTNVEILQTLKISKI